MDTKPNVSDNVFGGCGSSYPDYFLTFLQDSDYSLSFEDYERLLAKEKELVQGQFRACALDGNVPGELHAHWESLKPEEEMRFGNEPKAADIELKVCTVFTRTSWYIVFVLFI